MSKTEKVGCFFGQKEEQTHITELKTMVHLGKLQEFV